VDASREQEGKQGGRAAGKVKGRDGRMVDVAEEEVVDWAVPITGELVPGGGVPPVRVETPVGEAGHFG
jgi:hypothetical protein